MKQPTDTSIFLDKEKILESISKSGEYIQKMSKSKNGQVEMSVLIISLFKQI